VLAGTENGEFAPYFAPGQDIHYSNTDYILLGLLIEQITHRPVDEVLQQRIFAPLHMDHTSLPPRSSAALPPVHIRRATCL